jgi:hypothetical protein
VSAIKTHIKKIRSKRPDIGEGRFDNSIREEMINSIVKSASSLLLIWMPGCCRRHQGKVAQTMQASNTLENPLSTLFNEPLF